MATHGDDEAAKSAAVQKSNVDNEAQQESSYCILSGKEKIFSIVVSSLVNFLGPVTANIYYPALGALSGDLNTSPTKINLTITAYMIMQGLVPLLTASLSDYKGRRPVLLVGLLLYIAVNTGLALQNSYRALFVLRCFQSFGSSGCAVIAMGIVADLVPRHERGAYMAYSSIAPSLGPALGPVLGGIITHLAGWRGNFWFLVIWAGAMELVVLTALRETCRAVVGNGSVPPPRWNRSLCQTLMPKSDKSPDRSTVVQFPRRPSVLDGIKIALDKEIGLLVLFGTLTFCGSMAVLSTLPTLLERTYGFNALQIGLCYLPYSCGVITVRWTAGQLTDRNFRRLARRAVVEIVRNQQARLDDVPIEKARLQLILPLAYLSCVFMTVYAWLIKLEVHVAGPLVAMFFLGNMSGGVNSTLTTLLMDLHSKRPATVMSSLNLFRFVCGAGTVAAAMPLVEAIGIGWVGTLVALLLVLASPSLWVVYFKGHGWRMQKTCVQEA